MNQNETEFGEDLTHRQLLALPRRSEAGPHLGRAGPAHPDRPPALFNPNRIAKIYATQQAGVAQG